MKLWGEVSCCWYDVHVTVNRCFSTGIFAEKHSRGKNRQVSETVDEVLVQPLVVLLFIWLVWKPWTYIRYGQSALDITHWFSPALQSLTRLTPRTVVINRDISSRDQNHFLYHAVFIFPPFSPTSQFGQWPGCAAISETLGCKQQNWWDAE